MKFALIGQPNCGKSTLFNQVAGYKAETGNFSGTTVTFTESKVRVMGQVVEIVDLPGTYTLLGTNPAEREVLNYLSCNPVDMIINILDASHLAHGLELTLELLELQRPMIIALNMVDEARRIGLKINLPKLHEILGVKVLPLIASRGQGVKDVFVSALNGTREKVLPKRIQYSPVLEKEIQGISEHLDGAFAPLSSETVAIKLLEGDAQFIKQIASTQPDLIVPIDLARKNLLDLRGEDAVWVISGERHMKASQIAQNILLQGERRLTLRDRLDDVLLHPVWGYLALIAILFVFFEFVYFFGSIFEKPILAAFNWITLQMQLWIGSTSFWSVMALGLLQGISGGVAIVLPYLTPFLLGLGILEDIGYLPRVAFMMDALMHRLGLHGKAIVPFILGYGCNVPAIMSTRILEEERDRYLAAALATLVPCAARLAVVFGLVAYYLGPGLALAIYLFNLLVIALTARVLSGILPEDTPGLILEMPVYRLPTFKSVVNKAWFRVREFIVEAWPVLIIGSGVLALLNYLKLTRYFNWIAFPITWVLGLPQGVGVPLIFGVLRKELTLVMLRQALGVQNLSAAMTSSQMITFSVFVVFYIPCLATLTVIRRELGTKAMVSIAGLTVLIATLAALLARGVSFVFLHA
ncbi:MAG: ferrous iron transport protein B [Anaerolineaceae bacterium]|nr:ferrous iron transport protein B [Anaerolineaceae bacterium]